MGMSFGSASGYAISGCEIYSEIWNRLICWIVCRLKGVEDFYDHELTEILGCIPYSIASKLNGDHSYVYCVKVPESHILPEDLDSLRKISSYCLKHGGDLRRISSTTKLELRVIKNIPKSMFEAVYLIENQHWEHIGKIQSRLVYDVKRVL